MRLPPPLIQNQKLISQAIEEALAFLDPETSRSYLLFLKSNLSESAPDKNFPGWYFFYHFFLAGFLQGVIRYNRETLYSFGATLYDWETIGNEAPHDPWLHRNQERFITVSIEEQIVGSKLSITGVIPTQVEAIGRNILHKNILPFTINYFVHRKNAANNRIDCFSVLKHEIARTIEHTRKQGESLAMTHFHFSELHNIFEYVGYHRTEEIIQEIISTIHKYLKTDDPIFALTPTSYLALSPGANHEILAERFRGVFFTIKQIIFDYEINTVIIDREKSFEEIWQELRL